MLRSIIQTVSIMLCLLIISCSCDKIVAPDDKPVIITPPAEVFYPPSANGEFQYNLTKDTVFPSYMSNVKILEIRIPRLDTLKPLPAIIIEPGFFSVSTDLEDVSNRYATHGFVVLGVTNTSHYNLITTSLDPYKLALQETIHFVIESCKDPLNKLYNRIDTNSIGISGHSMGGGGTILACNAIQNEYNHYIKAAVAMNPFGKCSGTNIKIPIFLFSSEIDAVINPFMLGVSSSPQDVYYSYQSIPANVHKIFANFKGMDHNAVVDKNIFLNTSGNASLFLPSMVSWFKVYLSNDTRYQKYLDTTGSEYQLLSSRFIAKGTIPAYVYNK